MKIFKWLGLTSTLALATVPFVLPTKHEIVRYDNDIKEDKFFVDGFSKTKLDMFPIPSDWGKDLVIKKLLSKPTTMSNNFTTYQNYDKIKVLETKNNEKIVYDMLNNPKYLKYMYSWCLFFEILNFLMYLVFFI